MKNLKNMKNLLSDKNINHSDLVPVEVLEKEDVLEVADHATETSARNAIFRGTLDMQEALFNHASTFRGRLKRLAGVINNLEGKVFNEEFLNELDPRSMIKLLVLARESETEAIEYLERLHKLVQDSQRVIKVTQTLSMSGVTTRPLSIEEGGDFNKNLLDEARTLLIDKIKSATE